MSRCFPYPPPGYVRNGFGGEALIESIKLQREREKAEAERRRERKREKKEKRREKKERRKEKLYEIFDGQEKKHNDDRNRKGKNIEVDPDRGHLRKSEEAEQLEKSDLTEEHGQPICSENLWDSSDGMQNSSKRKRDISLSDGSHNNGNIIRFRLPSLKHKEHVGSHGEDLLCSTSCRTGSCAQQEYEITHVPIQEQCCSTSSGSNTVAKEFTSRANRELLCSSSLRTQISTKDGAGTASCSTFFNNEVQGAESLYKTLIEDWVPPPLQCLQTDDEDLQWLFVKKQQHRHAAKRFKTSSDDSCCRNSSSWPRAHFLSEADIFALPYTVPF